MLQTLIKLLTDNPAASLLGLGVLTLFIKDKLKGNTPDGLGKLLEAVKDDAKLEQKHEDIQSEVAKTEAPVEHKQLSPNEVSKGIDNI